MSEALRNEVFDDRANWYVRRGSAVQGPYGARQIARYLLLGRVRLTDRVSVDGQGWTIISDLPHLIPEEMRDLDSMEGRAKYLEARRRADERGVSGERGRTPPGARERRRRTAVDEATELGAIVSRYGAMSSVARQVHPMLMTGALAVVIVTVALMVAVIYTNARPTLGGGVNCDAVAAPGVDWRYCVKDEISLNGANLRGAKLQHAALRGADLESATLTGANLEFSRLSDAALAHADLRSASLAGADLRGALLNDADLDGADLTAANLSGAALDNASLSGVVLSEAIWTDGRKCAPGSIGYCVE